jgi:tetratricopeptide (TPR) repeat protein
MSVDLRRSPRWRWTGALVGSCAALLLAAPAQARDADRKGAAEERARIHVQRAADALREGRYDDAMTEFEAGYAIIPRPGFVLNMGHVQRQAGHPERARDYYRRYLQLDPKSPQRAEVERTIGEIDGSLGNRAGAAGARATPAPRKTVGLAPTQQDDEMPADIKALPAKPIITAPAPAEHADEPAFYQQWWFWGTAGAVVVGALVAFLVIRGRGDDYTTSGTWGTLGR